MTNLEIADARVGTLLKRATLSAKAAATAIRPGTGDTGVSLAIEILKTGETLLIGEMIVAIQVIDVIEEIAGIVVTARNTTIATGETLLVTTATSEIASTATAERTGIGIGIGIVITTKTGIMIGTGTEAGAITLMTIVGKSRLPGAINRDYVRTSHQFFRHSASFVAYGPTNLAYPS